MNYIFSTKIMNVMTKFNTLSVKLWRKQSFIILPKFWHNLFTGMFQKPITDGASEEITIAWNISRYWKPCRQKGHI